MYVTHKHLRATAHSLDRFSLSTTFTYVLHTAHVGKGRRSEKGSSRLQLDRLPITQLH